MKLIQPPGLRWTLLLFMLLSLPLLAEPQQRMQSETIRLHNKPASDIIPLIQPFLYPDAAVSGDNYIINIKTTKTNMHEIKEMIAKLDTPVHQLLISISFKPEVIKQATKKQPGSKQDEDKAEVRIYGSGGSEGKTKTYKTHGEQVDANLFTLRALEDSWATIRTGQSVPVIERHRNADGTVTQSVRYRQINSGFHVKPRLKGDKVTLDISAFGENQSETGGGEFNHYMTTSTVTIGINQWVPLSANNGAPVENNGNTVYKTSQLSQDNKHIFLKVEIIP